jgi:non-specific protein-tyrosine kinase
MILFTSAGPDEGKTSTLANVGALSALAGERVILLDCDLRRPSLHTIFGLANDSGLSALATGGAAIDSALQSTTLEGLSVVPSGPPTSNPAELLASKACERVLTALRGEADLILVDAPPAAGVADASLLAAHMDGVVLVLDATRTRRADAQRAKQQLEHVKARILGVVLNNAAVGPNAFRY